ncbi:MAG: ACT domain-containing protein [Fimbriimonas sp.]|nr:ACT domain-containing protein [Fimbriimonas sp.]
MNYSVLEGEYCIYKQDFEDPIFPVGSGGLWSVTRSVDEISVICRKEVVPDGVRVNKGWVCLEIEGPLDFELKGVLLTFLEPLAKCGISVLTLSTFDTDYVMIRRHDEHSAFEALAAHGHKLISSA